MTSGRTILITGATAGIGRHLALHLARRGHHVLATGRNQDALEQLRQEAGGARLDAFPLDVTSDPSIEKARATALRLTEGRGLDALVNNAGYGQFGPLELLTAEELRAQFDTNVFGLMQVTRAFLPEMRTRRAGRIVNISSVAGRMVMPFFGAYNASKATVEALSDALRIELAPLGIRVALIEPGLIRSEFAQRFVESGSRFRNASSPYARVLERADFIQALMDGLTVGPECVARDVEHAITSRRPRARYISPRITAAVLAFKALLPTGVMDTILRQLVGLTPRRMNVEGAAAAPPEFSPQARFDIH